MQPVVFCCMRVIVKYILIALAVAGCSSVQKQAKIKPEPGWVSQRPVSNLYYIGIGYASKLNGNDYAQVAKKNALQDMLSEIKVTVSTHSLLSQYQHNRIFSQQFLNDIKIVSEGTLEGFEVVDAYETATDFWIYYRLSKDEYEKSRQRKIQAAIATALQFLNEADKLNIANDFAQIFRLRVKALAALQNFANDNLETFYNGKQVFLMNEIVGLLQRQLYQLKLETNTQSIKTEAGKPLVNPVQIQVLLTGSNTPAAFIPIKCLAENSHISGNLFTESNQQGIASFYISKISGSMPVLPVTFKVDVVNLFKADSFNASMFRIIENFDAPFIKVQFIVEPIKIYSIADEKNLNQKLEFKMLETVIKNKLTASGCMFVSNMADAKYVLYINSNTKNEGTIWGNMQQSILDASIWLVDNQTKAEIFKEAISRVKGFQLTPEKAGLDAYTHAREELVDKILPRLQKVILYD